MSADRWPQEDDCWMGRVTGHAQDGLHFVVHDPRWPSLPPVGTEVTVIVEYRSPYWALVDEEEEEAK